MPVAVPLPGDGRWYCVDPEAGRSRSKGPRFDPGIIEIDGARCASIDDAKWSCDLQRDATQMTIEQRFDPNQPFVPRPRRWSLTIAPTRMTGVLRLGALEGPLQQESPVFAVDADDIPARCHRISPIDGIEHLRELYGAQAYTFIAGPVLDLAKAGDPAAQFLYGLMQNAGNGVPQDPAKAQLWLQKAADQGHVEAASNLVILLERAPELDHQRIFGLRMVLANAGQGRALIDVAAAYLLGVGTTKDEARAREWLARATEASNNVDEAVVRYAQLLIAGVGGPKDVAGAERLLRRHASTSPRSAVFLGQLIANEIFAGTPEEAVGWYRKAFASGSDLARVVLGLALIEGYGVPKDVAAGVELISDGTNPALVSNVGAYSTFVLGTLYWHGAGVPQDRKRGTALINAASAAGNSEAQLWFAERHRNGVFLDSTPVLAQVYFELAAMEKPVAGGESLPEAVTARDEHGAKLTPEQREEVRRKVNDARLRLLDRQLR